MNIIKTIKNWSLVLILVVTIGCGLQPGCSICGYGPQQQLLVNGRPGVADDDGCVYFEGVSSDDCGRIRVQSL